LVAWTPRVLLDDPDQVVQGDRACPTCTTRSGVDRSSSPPTAHPARMPTGLCLRELVRRRTGGSPARRRTEPRRGHPAALLAGLQRRRRVPDDGDAARQRPTPPGSGGPGLRHVRPTGRTPRTTPRSPDP